jgi:hypothetical protein
MVNEIPRIQQRMKMLVIPIFSENKSEEEGDEVVSIKKRISTAAMKENVRYRQMVLVYFKLTS